MRFFEEVSVGAHASGHIDRIPVEAFEIVDSCQAVSTFLPLFSAAEVFGEHLAVRAAACQQRPVHKTALKAVTNQVLFHGDYRIAR